MSDDKMERKCDKCGKFKEAIFSYCTERYWMCFDCKAKNIKSSVIKSLKDYNIVSDVSDVKFDIDQNTINMDVKIYFDTFKIIDTPITPLFIWGNTVSSKQRDLQNCKDIDEVLEVLIRYNSGRS